MALVSRAECGTQMAPKAESYVNCGKPDPSRPEHFKLQIAKLRRMQFGRKSEKLDHQTEQLERQLEDLQADEAEAAREMPEANQAPRKKSVRRPVPDHFEDRYISFTETTRVSLGQAIKPRLTGFSLHPLN